MLNYCFEVAIVEVLVVGGGAATATAVSKVNIFWVAHLFCWWEGVGWIYSSFNVYSK